MKSILFYGQLTKAKKQTRENTNLFSLFVVSVVYFILLLLYNLRHRVANKQAHKLRVKDYEIFHSILTS